MLFPKDAAPSVPLGVSPLRPPLDGGGIFRGCHSGLLFKLPGKIVDGGIAQTVGDLSKIQLVAANQLFCRVDFHPDKKFHDPAAMLLLK